MKKRNSPFRHIHARPRLFASIGIFFVILFLLPDYLRNSTRLLIAWDASIALYLILAMWMMAHSSLDKIRSRAAVQDEGRFAVLVLTTLTALASLGAIVAELATAKSAHGAAEVGHIALAGVTVFLSWTLMQTIYALHYTHEYFQETRLNTSKGLDFPGDEHPDYWDFMYFSIVIGAAAATADVNIVSKTLRRLVSIHCMISFFFNTTILALTVNIGASLF
jgi:uncharacterized membrane protein